MSKAKICSYCNVEKPLEEYYIRRASKDGLDTKCKKCVKVISKEKYEKNKLGLIPKAYKHPQELKMCPSCQTEKYASNFYACISSKDGLRSYCKLCMYNKQKTNRKKTNRNKVSQKRVKLTEEQKQERKRESDRQYRETHRAYLRERARERYQLKKEEIKQYQSNYKWHKINPEASRASVQKRRAMRNDVVTEDVSRQDIIDRDYSLCYICGNKFASFQIAVDHIEPLSKGGSHTYDNLTVTCHSCNSSKGNKTLLEYLLYVSASS